MKKCAAGMVSRGRVPSHSASWGARRPQAGGVDNLRRRSWDASPSHPPTPVGRPAPGATKSIDNGPKQVPRPQGASPKVPAGFQADLLAEGLTNPRKIVTAPNGDLFVAESSANRIRVLRPGADGKIQSNGVFAEGLNLPFGIAFYPPGPE